MFMTCNCGHSFTVDDGQSGQFVECPECGLPRLVGADVMSPTGIDGLQGAFNRQSVGPISIDTEVPLSPLTWRRSNCRIAINTENGTITFENCFVPDTGFWTLRRRVVESHSCSLPDVVRAFRYSTYSSNQDGWELGRGREQFRVTEIVTVTGKASFSIDAGKRYKRGDYEGDRDERLREICDYLNSEGYVSLEGTPPSHGVMLVVILLVAFLALALYFVA